MDVSLYHGRSPVCLGWDKEQRHNLAVHWKTWLACQFVIRHQFIIARRQ